MPVVPVHERRRILERAAAEGLDVWICEGCGEDCEEGLVVYEIERQTRARCAREACLCADCARRIPHGKIISD